MWRRYLFWVNLYWEAELEILLLFVCQMPQALVFFFFFWGFRLTAQLYSSDLVPVVTFASLRGTFMSIYSNSTSFWLWSGSLSLLYILSLHGLSFIKTQIWSSLFPTNHHGDVRSLSLYDEDQSLRVILPSLSLSFLFPLYPCRNVCVCVCVAETAREACNWVCPPTALQQKQRSGRLHCVRHNRYVHILITPYSHSATEPQHWRAISRCSSSVLLWILWPDVISWV